MVALLQAESLLGQDGLVLAFYDARFGGGEAGGHAARVQAIAGLASLVERLFHLIAREAHRKLRRKSSLTDSFLVLSKLGLLPLTEEERAAWREDEQWVNGQKLPTRTFFGRRRSDHPELWEMRWDQRLVDPRTGVESPRYRAMMELSKIRNEVAHGRAPDIRDLGLPSQVWSRMLGLTAMICVNAFAQKKLRPLPIWEAEARTISRRPPVREPTEAISASASFVEEEAPVRRRRRRRRKEAPKRTPEETPRRGRATKLLMAMCLFVALGMLVPRGVSEDVGAFVVRSLRESARLAKRVLQDRVRAAEAPVLQPVQVAPEEPDVALATAFEGLEDVPTERPEIVRSDWCGQLLDLPGDELLPDLMLDTGGERRFAAAPMDAEGLGRHLAVTPDVEAVLVLEAPRSLTRTALVEAVAARACRERPVLKKDEALRVAPHPDALVVAELAGANDWDVDALVRLAEEGRTPRLLLVVPPGALPPAFEGAPRLKPMAFGCEHAMAAVRREGGAWESVIEERFASWRLFEEGSESCSPVTDIEGAVVVAAAMRRKRAPPEEFAGTWGAWVDAGMYGARSFMSAPTGMEQGPAVPRLERAARRRAAELTDGVEISALKRGVQCRVWVNRVGDSLGEPGVFRHLVGTKPGLNCLAPLLAEALTRGVEATRAVGEVDRGLGTHRRRSLFIGQALDDLERRPYELRVTEVLNEVGSR